MAAPDVLVFGEFRLDVAGETLERDGVPVPLTPKAYALLRHFLSHPGTLCTKDDLLDAVWPGMEVGDAVLKVCVAELRRALDDRVASPRYVATVHRHGYRFIAALAAEATIRDDRPSSASRDATRSAKRDGLVGRDGALRVLDAALIAARAGERQVVFVTGEAGIGKTTLVEAFLAGLDGTVRATRGQCLEPYGAGEAFLPWLDALGRLCSEPSVLAALGRVAPAWVATLPGRVADVPPRVAPSRARMLLELAEGLECLAAETPLVVVLEDLHWSDHSTLDVLSRLAQRAEPARLVVIATYRPVELVVRGHPLRGLKADLELRRRCREVALEFLSEREVEEYLAIRLATATVPDGLVALVHARTDGNPLFVTHLLDLALQRGWLREDADGWHFDAGPASTAGLVPDTLRQMIADAIATLAPGEQEVLEAAAVVGAEPTAAAVAAALTIPLAEAEDTLVDLARRGHLLTEAGTDTWPDGTRTARFAFIHALYRDVLQQRLAEEDCRRLHARVGVRLERAFGPDAGSIAAELAQHFVAAGDGARAVVHLRHAGTRAVRRHAYREGIDHFEQAIALLQSDDATRAAAELELRMRLGPALMAVYGFAAPNVERCYTQARNLCAAVGMTPVRARAVRGLGIFSLARGELLQARSLAEESLAIAESGDVTAVRGQAHVTLGTTLYYLGELDAAATQLARARRLLARAPLQPPNGAAQAPVVSCLTFLAMTSWFRGHPDAALALTEDARDVAEELGHPLSRLWSAHVTAVLHHLRGEPSRAAAVAAVAIRLATDLGFRQWVAWGTFFHGWIATLDDRVEAGLAGMQAGLDEYRATGAELGRVYFSATLAEAHVRAGQPDRALAIVDESLASTTARSERYFTAELHRVRAGLLPDRAAREAELRQAVTLATRQGNRALALRAATDLAVTLGGTAGRRVLTPHVRWWREGLDTADFRTASATLAALDTSRGVTPSRRRRS